MLIAMKYLILCLILSYPVFAFKTLRHSYEAYKDSNVATRFNKNTPDYAKTVQYGIDASYSKKGTSDKEIAAAENKKTDGKFKIETENTLIDRNPVMAKEKDAMQTQGEDSNREKETDFQVKTKEIEAVTSKQNVDFYTSKNRMPKDDLQKILKVSVASPDKKTQNAHGYTSIAHQALEMGFFEAALHLFDMVLKTKPDDVNALLGKAVCYHKLRQYNDAFRFYSLVLRVSPSNKIATSNIVSILSNIDVTSAMERITPLYKSNPDRHDVVALMGVIYAKSGYSDEGIELLSKAVKLNPSNPTYNYNLAILYDKGQDKKQAIYYYKRTLDNKSPAFGINYSQIQDRIRFLNAKK